MPIYKDGKYEFIDKKDGKLFLSFNLYNDEYYGSGKCYYYDTKTLQSEAEYSPKRKRTIGYSRSGRKLKRENTGFDMDAAYIRACYSWTYLGEMDVAIFHYSSGYKSYREKNNVIVKYYKNGYMKSMYKSKNLFFY